MGWTHPPKGRSIRCNGEALRLARGRRGFTQPELGHLAGLSARVVAKAEASQNLHPNTIEILADTLSTKARPVFPEDLVISPRQIARLIMESYAKHERQCLPHFVEYLAEDMEVSVPGDPSLLPFAGDRKSIDGFDDFWGAFFSVMERPHKKMVLDNMRVIEDGNQVIVLTRERVRFDGLPEIGGGAPVALVMEFERGRLKRFEDHFDVGKAADNIRIAIRRKEAALARNGRP